ncbi:hypothetical protein C7M84_012920 [Penaeus vannamei]|uniref:Uncharacterized protein n=1 Tax=Penaeus vannamei TaxID=6689 RepID=A0A423SXG9_PENVA|nr:hypothetical protein C7M84_012920 [Penaeus vannamei]
MIRLHAKGFRYAFGDVAMQVVDVSYDSWALLWACKRSMFGHMEAGIILSRSTGIGSGTLEKLRNTLAANGGELDSMATVQHGQCTGGGVCICDVDYALSVDEYYDLYGDQLENEDSYDYYGDYYDYADGEGNEVYDYYDDYGDYYGDYEDYYESDGNSSDSDYYDDYYYDDYGYGDYDYDPARFEGRRCILIIDDEPVAYDECPEDYLYYAYLPEEYYQLQDFVGSPCYTFEDGEYMYYEECPEGTEGAIPASFMDFDDATARMGKRPLTGKAKRKEERREKRKERRKKMRAMKRKKKNGGKKGARKNGKNGGKKGARKNGKNGKRNGAKGNKKGKGTKGKGKNRRKNKKSRSEIDDLEKIKKPKGEDLLRLIRNNKKVQKLLEEAGVSWRDLTPDIRLSKLRKMVGNKKLWKEIRKELVPKRVSSGWQRRMDKPQGLELWLMLTTNKKLIKLLLKAEVELTGKPFDLRFDDLRKMIKNKKIWKKIKSVSGHVFHYLTPRSPSLPPSPSSHLPPPPPLPLSLPLPLPSTLTLPLPLPLPPTFPLSTPCLNSPLSSTSRSSPTPLVSSSPLYFYPFLFYHSCFLSSVPPFLLSLVSFIMLRLFLPPLTFTLPIPPPSPFPNHIPSSPSLPSHLLHSLHSPLSLLSPYHTSSSSFPLPPSTFPPLPPISSSLFLPLSLPPSSSPPLPSSPPPLPPMPIYHELPTSIIFAITYHYPPQSPSLPPFPPLPPPPSFPLPPPPPPLFLLLSPSSYSSSLPSRFYTKEGEIKLNLRNFCS